MITPVGDKVERLRKHRRIIQRQLIQLAHDALWYHEFIDEAVQFPYGPFDDQMDAMSQYLAWIAEHPNLNKRPPMAVIQATDSRGWPIRTSATPTAQGKRLVVQLGRPEVVVSFRTYLVSRTPPQARAEVARMSTERLSRRCGRALRRASFCQRWSAHTGPSSHRHRSRRPPVWNSARSEPRAAR